MTKYSDLDFDLDVNPITNDISLLKDEKAISIAVYNLICFLRLERFLFRNGTLLERNGIKDIIKLNLSKFREIKVKNIDVDFNNHLLDINLSYWIKGDNTRLYNLNIPIRKVL